MPFVAALVTHIGISTYSSFKLPLQLLQQLGEINLAVSIGLLKPCWGFVCKPLVTDSLTAPAAEAEHQWWKCFGAPESLLV